MPILRHMGGMEKRPMWLQDGNERELWSERRWEMGAWHDRTQILVCHGWEFGILPEFSKRA